MIEPILYLPRVLLEQRPFARALLSGAVESSQIRGEVFFFPFQCGSLLLAAVNHLPLELFLGFQILPHPPKSEKASALHELPPLLSAGGFAYSLFYTDQFYPRDVLDCRLSVYSLSKDGFRSCDGSSGTQFAEGLIRKI